MRGSLPQITQIYTDIGYGGEGHESHGRSTRKKSVTIRDICGRTFSQEKSVTIRDICGKTFSSSVRGSLPQITQIYTDIGYGKKDTNHTDVA